MTRDEILVRAANMKPLEPTFAFGKHRDRTVAWVLANDPGYLVWAYNTVDKRKLPKTLTRDVYEEALEADYEEDPDWDTMDFWALEMTGW
jgi:hypothetical protein